MAGCSQTLKGLQLSCDTSKGGIKEVYIAKYPGMGDNGYTSGLTITADTVTVIDSGVTFYKYEFRRNTGSMTSTLNVDDANGTNYVSTDLVLQFNKMETAKRVEMSALSLLCRKLLWRPLIKSILFMNPRGGLQVFPADLKILMPSPPGSRPLI